MVFTLGAMRIFHLDVALQVENHPYSAPSNGAMCAPASSSPGAVSRPITVLSRSASRTAYCRRCSSAPLTLQRTGCRRHPNDDLHDLHVDAETMHGQRISHHPGIRTPARRGLAVYRKHGIDTQSAAHGTGAACGL